ncbi:hypothetical protein C5167_035932 [Papaver somniferum]|nr:hypothetical protein C5167_035932 [Papaver somniferum]
MGSNALSSHYVYNDSMNKIIFRNDLTPRLTYGKKEYPSHVRPLERAPNESTTRSIHIASLLTAVNISMNHLYPGISSEDLEELSENIICI